MCQMGIGPGLGFKHLFCSSRQCEVCIAFFTVGHLSMSLHGHCMVQFSSYLLSLGKGLPTCLYISLLLRVPLRFYGTPVGAIGGWQFLITELNTHILETKKSK